MLPDGVFILIQPHHWKRPVVAITGSRKRQPVATLVNPVFQPLINSAMAAIETVIHGDRFELIGTSHHRFRVYPASLAALRRYLHVGIRPPRFPAGGRQRLEASWRRRPEGARIEVSEFLTIVALRASSVDGKSRSASARSY